MLDLVPLIGEPLPLDLINTRPRTAAGPVDMLATPEGLGSWLAQEAGRIAGFPSDEPVGIITETDLDAVHAVREHTAVAVDRARRGVRPPAAALRGLNEAQHAAPAIRELTWNGATVLAAWRRAGPVGVRLAAQLADATAALLVDPAIATVRPCDGPGCVILFLPAHPRRRWCSAARCGNRARVARYYQQHKAASGRGPEPGR